MGMLYVGNSEDHRSRIKENVTLTFDPAIDSPELDDEQNKTLQEVFANRMARTIWLGIKQGHVVDQDFTQNCLNAANVIERVLQDGPPNLRGMRLGRYLSNCNMLGSSETEFGKELLPFIDGEKEIEFTVEIT